MKKSFIKKALSILLSFTMVLPTLTQAFAANPSDFSDLPTGWSREAVTAAVANGLLNGRTPTTIEPTGNLTRAELATVINRAFGATRTADISSFTDVSPEDWFYTEIAKAVNMQTLQGDGAGTMRPNDPIKREEVFAVVARALVLETSDYSALSAHPDSAYVSEWAKPYAAILSQKGYINGDEKGNLNPHSNITREEFAQILHNIIKTYYVGSGTYTKTGSDSSLIRTSGVILRNVTIEGDLIIGDGVGYGSVALENVTIKGRLLCRGGENSIRLVNTKVGEGVVVKDVNGVVHFDNYKSEDVFKNIIEITKATYKGDNYSISMGGGASSDDTYYTITISGAGISKTYSILEDDTFTLPSPDMSTYPGFAGWRDKNGTIRNKAETITVNEANDFVAVFKYKIEHYFQNEIGSDAYSVDSSKTQTKKDVLGASVSATALTDITGYVYDELNASNVKTGVVNKEGTLTLKLYYKKEGTMPSVQHVVKFYEGAKADPTKLIGQASVVSGEVMSSGQIENAFEPVTDRSQDGYVDGLYTHKIYPELWYVTSDGKWKAFDDSVVINSDMDVFYSVKSISLFLKLSAGSYNLSQPVSFSVPYQRDTRLMDTLKDALTLARTKIDVALKTDDIYEKAIMQEASRTKGLIDNNGNIKFFEVDTEISKIIRPSEIEGEIRDYIVNIIVDNSDDEKIESAILMVKDSHLIENDVLGGGIYNFNDIKNYITSKTPAEREAFALDIYNVLRGKQYYIDFIDAFESDHSEFEVTHENLDFVMAVATAINEYTYEGLKDRIHDKFGKIINAIGDDIAEEFMTDSQQRYYAGAQVLWDDMKAHKGDPTYTSHYPSYLTFKVDPIEDVFKPVFTKARAKAIDKLTQDYYYTQNTYLSDLLVDADTLIADLFYPVPVTEENVGYALWPSNVSESGFMHYYDYITEKIILLDKALLWYGDEQNLTPTQLEDMKQTIYELAAKSLNKLNTFIDEYETDGSLPMGMSIDQLKSFAPLGSIIEKTEGKLDTAINKYKSTRFYTTHWTGDSVKNDISYSQLLMDVLFGTDVPVFNVDAFMDADVAEKVIEKAGFENVTDTFDQEMGNTVTVQLIERFFKQNHIKVRRFYQ